jgi:hypothetical protein
LKEVAIVPLVEEHQQLELIDHNIEYCTSDSMVSSANHSVCSFTDIPHPIPKFTPESFLKELTAFNTQVKGLSDKHIRSYEVEQFTMQFPLPKEDFWKKMPSQQIMPILEQLYSLLRSYYECTRDEKLRFILEKKSAVLSIYATMCVLALSKDKFPEEFQKALWLPFALFGSADLCICCDKEVSKRYEQLLSYVSAIFSVVVA